MHWLTALPVAINLVAGAALIWKRPKSPNKRQFWRWAMCINLASLAWDVFTFFHHA